METIRRPEHALHLCAPQSGARCRRVFAPAIAVCSLAIILLGPAFASARAQDSGTLSGVVSGPDKKRLPDARVTIVGTRLVALADSDGTFLIAALPSGGAKGRSQAVGVPGSAVACPDRGRKDCYPAGDTHGCGGPARNCGRHRRHDARPQGVNSIRHNDGEVALGRGHRWQNHRTFDHRSREQ